MVINGSKFVSTDYQDEDVVVTVRFPTYAQIVGNKVVIADTEKEWQNTLNECTQDPNERRERGFWIRLDTTKNEYGHSHVTEGDPVGPTAYATINLPPRPADIPSVVAANAEGAIYYVASFHTHPPNTYRDGLNLPPQSVGPSDADNNADTNDKVPGVVYDYIEDPAGSGTIYHGHPKDAPAQRYHSQGLDRRPTPDGG